MTAGGWVFMLCSVSFVVGLAFWCFWRVLSAPPHRADETPPAGAPAAGAGPEARG